ncbi:MAG: hypothetical protein J7L99_05950, partial [Planctomycetes bacterium]|nr:hypothetical protein [Planctomycetota bacterium]
MRITTPCPGRGTIAMMLAGIKDYLFWWQLPLIGIIALTWLSAGQILIQRTLRRYTQIPRTKTTTSTCLRLNILGIGAGLLVFIIIASIFMTISWRYNSVPIATVGILIGFIMTLAISFTIISILLNANFKLLLKPVIISAGIFGLLAVVCALAVYLPAYNLRHIRIQKGQRLRYLADLSIAFKTYSTNHNGVPASSLRDLISAKLIDLPPDNSDTDVNPLSAYVYVPVYSEGEETAPQSEKIWVAHFFKPTKEWLVLFTNGQRVVIN